MIVEIHNFTQNKINEKLFRKVSEIALKIIEKERPDLKIKGEPEISLAIVGDGRMKRLNKIYRGRNRTTDVLSFSNLVNSSEIKKKGSAIKYLTEMYPKVKGEKFIEPPDGIKRLGEIVISHPRAKKQAKRIGHSLKKELAILLIHGILHLFGYEDEKGEKQRKEMEAMEKRILKEVEKEILLE